MQEHFLPNLPSLFYVTFILTLIYSFYLYSSYLYYLYFIFLFTVNSLLLLTSDLTLYLIPEKYLSHVGIF